jgi:hypothetical protein
MHAAAYNQQGYPYYGQPVNPYPPPPQFGYPGPSNQPPVMAPYYPTSYRHQPTPYPTYNELPASAAGGSRSKRLSGSGPKKSAMKKPEPSGAPLTRTRTVSGSNPGPPLSRARTTSNPKTSQFPCLSNFGFSSF